MKKQLIGILIGLSVLFFGSAAHAATVVPVDATYNVSSGFATEIVTSGSAVHYYEFNIGASDVNFVLSLFDTAPDFQNVVYNLYNDLFNGTNATSASLGALLQTFSAVDSTGVLTVSWTLLAGQHYVLSIDPANRTVSTLTDVSAVPLPGAALLFGTALFGAGMFSRKNKIAKNDGLAAIAA